MIATLIATPHRLDLALRLYADRHLHHTWRSAWRRAGELQ